MPCIGCSVGDLLTGVGLTKNNKYATLSALMHLVKRSFLLPPFSWGAWPAMGGFQASDDRQSTATESPKVQRPTVDERSRSSQLAGTQWADRSAVS